MLPFYLSDFREFHLRDPSTLGILNEVQQRKIISPSFLERFGFHSSGVLVVFNITPDVSLPAGCSVPFHFLATEL